MATVSSPLSHSVGAAGFSDAGWRPTFALEGPLREKLMDNANLMTSGFVPLVGDVSGTGSKTMRLRYLDAIGYGLSMASAANENTSVTPSAVTATTADVSIGRYMIGYLNTYTNQIIATPGELTTEGLADYIAKSYIAAWMDLLATTIATAATTSGQSGVPASFDDWLDVTYYYDGLEGQVNAIGLLHGTQFSNLKDSWRDEPNFQMPEFSDALLSLKGGPGFKNILLGIPTYVSSRVTAGSGNRKGAVWAPGAVVWARGGTQSIKPSVAAENVINMPDLGLILEMGGVPGDATGRIDGNAFFGMALGDGELIRGFQTKQ